MKQKDRLIESIEAPNYIVGLRNDDIVHVFYKNNTIVDLKLQKELVLVFNDITCGEKKCFIFQAGKSVSMTSEARLNAIKLEKELPFMASVVIAQNAFIRIIAEFYYRINRPKTPYNFFTKFEDGIAWLNDFQK